MEEGEGEGKVTAHGGAASVMPMPAASATGEVVVAAKPKSEDDAVSAESFLKHSGLGQLVETFQAAGFVSKEDVICLTPRRYEVVGVDKIGTQIRLRKFRAKRGIT